MAVHDTLISIRRGDDPVGYSPHALSPGHCALDVARLCALTFADTQVKSEPGVPIYVSWENENAVPTTEVGIHVVEASDKTYIVVVRVRRAPDGYFSKGKPLESLLATFSLTRVPHVISPTKVACFFERRLQQKSALVNPSMVDATLEAVPAVVVTPAQPDVSQYDE